MCGVYGYIGLSADFDIIKNIATLAETRGPHAFGFSYFKGGKLFTYKNTGKLSKDINQLKRVEGSQCIIGHARLSTSGDFREERNNQPITDGGETAIVHNGNFYSYKALYRKLNYQPYSECDSEALWLVFHRNHIDPLKLHKSLSPHSVLAVRSKDLFVMNNGLPLFMEEHKSGTIFCSRRMSDKSEELINSFIHYVIK